MRILSLVIVTLISPMYCVSKQCVTWLKVAFEFLCHNRSKAFIVFCVACAINVRRPADCVSAEQAGLSLARWQKRVSFKAAYLDGHNGLAKLANWKI